MTYPKEFIDWLHGMSDPTYTDRMYKRWLKEDNKKCKHIKTKVEDSSHRHYGTQTVCVDYGEIIKID